MRIKFWIEAFRLRTLPLSLSCIGMGGTISYVNGFFDLQIFLWVCLTTVLLQILSNLANDYGDSENGADHDGREGPSRATQEGKISMMAMKKAIIILVILSLISGIYLLWLSFGSDLSFILPFFVLGIASIAAAIKYTMGKNPYGYAGLGDISVFVFFGLVGVAGTSFVISHSFYALDLLPAIGVGLLSTGVLNINNIRDIESDKTAGKISVPVRLGKDKAVIYHWFLLFGAMVVSTLYVFLLDLKMVNYAFLITFPLFIKNGLLIQKGKKPMDIDPGLKQLSLSTLLFVIVFSLPIFLG